MPTSGLLTGEGHIPLACTPDPQVRRAAHAVRWSPAETTFEYAMKVTRIWEAPRVTKPYTEEQWEAIDSLGRGVDERLSDGRRATHDGRRAHVRRRARIAVAPEWNTAALGENKRKIAAELFGRLKQRYAPLGLAHFGQGKWYPGEPLPRWSLNCFWRKDGEPIWDDARLVADETRQYPRRGRERSAAACAPWRIDWASPPSTFFPPTRTRSTICGASANFRPMTIR